jgi:hypothetical protein
MSYTKWSWPNSTTLSGYVLGSSSGTVNSTSFTNAFNALGSNGGYVLLPAGIIAVSSTITVPSNITLFGQGSAYASDQCTTITTGTSWTGSNPLITMSNQNATLYCLYLDDVANSAFSGAPGTANQITISGTSCEVFDCGGNHTGSTAGITITTAGGQAQIVNCARFVGVNQSDALLLLQGADLIMSDCRFVTGTKTFAKGGFIVSNCHFTGGSPNNIILNDGSTNISAGVFHGCYFDSSIISTSGGTGLIHHQAQGAVLMNGCMFYPNPPGGSNTNGVPIILESDTESSVMVVGGKITNVGASSKFTEVFSGDNKMSRLDGVVIDLGSVTGNSVGTVSNSNPGTAQTWIMPNGLGTYGGCVLSGAASGVGLIGGGSF